MKAVFELAGEPRAQLGRTDSRRLRKAGKVPAIMYGGGEAPEALVLDHNALKNQMSREAFYTSILTLKIGPKSQQVVVKGVERHPAKPQVMHVIGEVSGKTCVLIDDMVDTAGTLCQAAGVLKERGAVRVVAYITHPVLSGPAVSRITASSLDEIVVTDTIPLNESARACPRIRQLSVAELLAETLRRINESDSVSSLYLD